MSTRHRTNGRFIWNGPDWVVQKTNLARQLLDATYPFRSHFRRSKRHIVVWRGDLFFLLNATQNATKNNSPHPFIRLYLKEKVLGECINHLLRSPHRSRNPKNSAIKNINIPIMPRNMNPKNSANNIPNAIIMPNTTIRR